MRNNEVFSSTRWGPSLPTRPELVDTAKSEHARLQQSGAILNSMDPPKHPKMRQQMMAQFTPKMVDLMESKIRDMAGTILDDIPKQGPLDFVKDIAARLPITIIFSMMEIPPSDWLMLLTLSILSARRSRHASTPCAAWSTIAASLRCNVERIQATIC